MLARGNAKTTMASLIGLHPLMTVRTASVVIGASSRDQARIAFERMEGFLEHEALEGMVTLRHLELRYEGRKLRVVPSDGPRTHGLSCSLYIGDEVWSLGGSGRSADGVPDGAGQTARRQVLLISTSIFDAMRVDVRRRLYRGRIDIPKSNKVRRIALTPPARDTLLGLPSRREGGLVFRSKTGKRAGAADADGLLGAGAGQGRRRVRLLPLDEAPVRALHARRSRAAAAGDRGADGLAARRGVEAPRDVRARRRWGTRGDRQSLPGDVDAAAGGQLRCNSDADRGDWLYLPL